MNTNDNIPPGLKLRPSLISHNMAVTQVAWSPDGKMLASHSSDHTIAIWDIETGQLWQTREASSNEIIAWSPDGKMLALGSGFNLFLWNIRTGESRPMFKKPPGIHCLAWSLDGRILVSDFKDNSIRLWNAKTGQLLQELIGHTDIVRSVTLSPDGQTLASGANDRRIILWDIETGKLFRTLIGHSQFVTCVAWSPDGSFLASSSIDNTIRLWDFKTGQAKGILEGHWNAVTSISISFDGHLLASKSRDGTIRLWHLNTGETVAILSDLSSYGERVARSSYYNSKRWNASLAFHPEKPILATLGKEDTDIQIWDLDLAAILGAASSTASIHYTNAKIVLVGDSGVGKSSLGNVLTDRPFVSADSTHGRRVWTFDNREVELEGGRKETRETLLWDLAGQPGYRLIHQLHLNEVAVALVVFDAHSETDPFAGVHHWARALQVARRKGDSVVAMKKILVAARIDRGGKSVSRERIDALMRELGFDSYFETSAKERLNIESLTETIKNSIAWEMLPRVTSNDLFQHIKTFLIAEKEAGRLLSTEDDLYRTFLNSKNAPRETGQLRVQFETCIGLVESRGLIRRLNFGNLVLLQPELLDGYASALINAVRNEPDGLGSISEEKVRAGNFPMPKDERVVDREQEKLLLIAMVEDLLRYEIALREQGEEGAYLIFPSQSTRENPDLPDPEGKAAIFRFEGPVQNIYTSLAVRLSHSGLFMKKELWKNAVTYTTKLGGIYGIFLHNLGEGLAELVLFFDKVAREETRFHFEEYVRIHLERRALPNTIQRRRIFVCPECGTPLDDLSVTRRRERGFNSIRCGVCETVVSLLDREERLAAEPISLIAEMDLVADNKRDASAAVSTLQGKIAMGDFDVFLCHNGKDKPELKKIGEQLKERGILPWLDEWELRPGVPWQRLLEKQIRQIKSAAVFVGKDGTGPWQQMELEAFLRQFVRRRCPVIPVVLADAPKNKRPKLPTFLEGMTWIDFRKQDPAPMEQLIWGITGERDRIL